MMTLRNKGRGRKEQIAKCLCQKRLIILTNPTDRMTVVIWINDGIGIYYGKEIIGNALNFRRRMEEGNAMQYRCVVGALLIVLGGVVAPVTAWASPAAESAMPAQAARFA